MAMWGVFPIVSRRVSPSASVHLGMPRENGDCFDNPPDDHFRRLWIIGSDLSTDIVEILQSLVQPNDLIHSE